MGAAGIRLLSSGGNTRTLCPRENARDERENVRDGRAGMFGMSMGELNCRTIETTIVHTGGWRFAFTLSFNVPNLAIS